MNKISRKAFLILILTSLFLVGGWLPNLWAATFTFRVHDGGDNLDATKIDGTWIETRVTITSNETAEGTANAIRIDAGTASSFIYSSPSPGSNWTWTPYAAFYMAMWLYSNDGSGLDTLSIRITEEDPDGSGVAGTGVPQTWTLTSPISLTWTGWRYVSVRLPEGTIRNDFTPLPTTEPDGTRANFNPAPVRVPPPYPPGTLVADGVTRLEMILTNNSLNNPSIYVDRIALSSGTATVEAIFPTNDGQASDTDIILDRAPYTISAMLSGVDFTHALNRISIVRSNNSTILLNAIADIRNDGVSGLFATPSSPPLSGGPFTIFIMPVDSFRATGEAEVITFQVSPPGTAVGTEYHREVTEPR